MSSQNTTIEDNSVSIILSTYNEAPVIEDTLKKIFETIKGVEIILVDDNSTDGTLEKVNKFKEFNIKIFSRKDRGLASAFLLGLINTTGKKIGWIDSNMGDLIKFFPSMIKDLNDNDIILLSRYVENGSDNRSKLRVISSKLINFFCRLVLSNKIKDYTSSIFIMKRSCLKSAVPIGYGHGEFFIEFLYKCLKANLKIKEIPYIQPPDEEGLSKTASGILSFFRLGLNYIIRIIIIKIR
tara:strand:+ start:34 stop:750 length:717 start_codon:yes stop_codon:yes gene_type:complete